MIRSLAFLFFLVPGILSAQSKTFSYYRKGKHVTMGDDNAIYWYGGYVLKGINKEKLVQLKNTEYRIIIRNDGASKVKTLVNAKDSVMATISLKGKNRDVLLLPDGRMLEREKQPSGNWVYKSDGKEVIRYRAEKKGAKKSVIVEYYDSTLPVTTMEIICLEHGAGFLYENHTLLVVGIAVGLALMRVAIGAGS